MKKKNISITRQTSSSSFNTQLESTMSSSIDASTHVSIFRRTSLLSSVSRLSPACSILFPVSSSNLSLSVTALSLRSRKRLTAVELCGSVDGEFESVDDEDELDGIEEDVVSDYEDVGDDDLDVDELELEAVKAVREYSVSLSQELKIGACFIA